METAPRRGVFWIVDGELWAFPFEPGKWADGIAKSGKTYNHEKLRPLVRGTRHVPYNYDPRGRVERNTKHGAVIYMNPHVPQRLFPEICRAFSIDGVPQIRLDHSEHYKCRLDDGWRPAKIK